MSGKLLPCLALAGAFTLALPLSAAEGVIRNGDVPGRPILSSVEVPAGKNIVFLSGMVPPVLNPEAPPEQRQFGSMEQQTTAVLERIQAHLEELGLSMGDVIKAQAFLVKDPDTGQVDRAGFNAAFSRFFGTEAQPVKPARSAFEIAGLGSPRMLVEIEVIAVRP
jgi:enamine deaminase RidA (YjgF/YER057c/UK114 family)